MRRLSPRDQAVVLDVVLLVFIAAWLYGITHPGH